MLCSDDLSMTDLAPPVAGSGAAATPSKEAVIPAKHGLSVSGLAAMAYHNWMLVFFYSNCGMP